MALFGSKRSNAEGPFETQQTFFSGGLFLVLVILLFLTAVGGGAYALKKAEVSRKCAGPNQYSEVGLRVMVPTEFEALDMLGTDWSCGAGDTPLPEKPGLDITFHWCFEEPWGSGCR